jgi:hypothetical protein
VIGGAANDDFWRMVSSLVAFGVDRDVNPEANFLAEECMGLWLDMVREWVPAACVCTVWL